MSLPTDAAPPGHLPPAATAPWPIQPPPHGAPAFQIPVSPVERKSEALGWMGPVIAAAAAAVGLAVAVPVLLARRSRLAGRGRKGRAKA